MNLYCLKFVLYLFTSLFIFKVNINGFNCCLGFDKNDIKYVEIDLQNPSQKTKSEKLSKILKQNNLNETMNVNLIDNKDKPKDDKEPKDEKDQLSKENEIIKYLENVFLKDGFWVKIDEIDIKNINDCCNVLPKDLFIYYDGSTKIVVSKNEENLKNYFNEKNKDNKNVEMEELKFEGLTRVDLDDTKDNNDKFSIAGLKKKLLSNKSININDCDSILFIIFKVGKEDNVIARDIKFDIDIYYKKKTK